MTKDWEYYTYEAMNILIKPNVKSAIQEISERCRIKLEDAATLVQKYKFYDYQDACSKPDNQEFFYGKARIINWVATEIQKQETKKEEQGVNEGQNMVNETPQSKMQPIFDKEIEEKYQTKR